MHQTNPHGQKTELRLSYTLLRNFIFWFSIVLCLILYGDTIIFSALRVSKGLALQIIVHSKWNTVQA